MKKLFLILALLIAAQAGQAQTAIEAGTVQLSGNGSYSTQTSESAVYYTEPILALAI